MRDNAQSHHPAQAEPVSYTHLDVYKRQHLYKAGRSLYWERPAVFMLQQARLVELPALSAIPHIHAGLPRC